MGWPVATNDQLWHVNAKINTDHKGFNFKFHLANMDEAAARAAAIRLLTRLRWTMPTSSEIVAATLNKDDTAPDSRMIPDVIGNGLHVVSPATTSKFDNSSTALLVRFEHDAGLGVTRKFCPIPDFVVENQSLVTAISGLVGIVAAPATAAGSGADWYAEMRNLMQDLAFTSKAIKSGHSPGGAYQRANFVNAYVMRIGVKKGGKIFTP